MKMCMVIDANTISIVFNGKNDRHMEYDELTKWFLYQQPKICLGGYLLKKELKEKMFGYFTLLVELSRFNKVHFISDNDVDALTEQIRMKDANPDFDDPHIVALIIASRAKLLCSDDARSFCHIKDNKLYPKGFDIPKIYTAIDHKPQKDLLSDRSICNMDDHKPMNKKDADFFYSKIMGNN
jgi:hypothetical protein